MNQFKQETGNASACPACHTTLGGWTGVNNNKTSIPEGAFTLCLYCGTWLRFEHGDLRLATTAERLDLAMQSPQEMNLAERVAQRFIEHHPTEKRP